MEQNTRHKAEPSTLYQVYRCIKITRLFNGIPIINNVPTRNDPQSSPATSNAIRGAEQSGNIANQWFARTWWVRVFTRQFGRHDKQVVGIIA